MKPDLHNICEVSVHHSAYSETFIRAHVERLPAKVFHLYGGYMPLYNSEGDLFVQSSFYKKFPSLIFLFASKKNIELIEKYLVDNKIEAARKKSLGQLGELFAIKALVDKGFDKIRNLNDHNMNEPALAHS